MIPLEESHRLLARARRGYSATVVELFEAECHLLRAVPDSRRERRAMGRISRALADLSGRERQECRTICLAILRRLAGRADLLPEPRRQRLEFQPPLH